MSNVEIGFQCFQFILRISFGHVYQRRCRIWKELASANPEAFIISQTLGGNKMTVEEVRDMEGGGVSAGGGSSDTF